MSPPPRSGLPLRALSPGDAWVDDPGDHNYNRLVSLPYASHAEPMWLDDSLYDLLVVIGYNMTPVVAGAGSAIFLHIARSDFSPTGGCIAIDKEALVRLVPLLGPGSTIAIRG
jgi:L,D-peptidoglycan transpeptidase YkuD (ErfK/YbiS/YcfS/YnhG family)